MGIILEEGLKKRDEAIVNYRKAIELDPNFEYAIKRLNSLQSAPDESEAK